MAISLQSRSSFLKLYKFSEKTSKITYRPSVKSTLFYVSLKPRFLNEKQRKKYLQFPTKK